MTTDTAAPTLTPEALKLLELFDQNVDRDTFNFAGDCLTIQTREALGLGYTQASSNELATLTGVPEYQVWRIFDAWPYVPLARQTDYEYCRGIAARILAGESLDDIEKTENP